MLAHLFLLFFFLRHSLVFAPVYNRPAVTESFERPFTATFVYTSSNVSMDTMTDSWDPSGTLRDAPCEGVSRFLLEEGIFFARLRESKLPRDGARVEVSSGSPPDREIF